MPPPMTNITITVPEGTSNHGDPNLLCVPSKWTDVLLFYAANYLAHAATVKTFPGERIVDTTYFIVMALLYPFSGLLRGLEAIFRRAAWSRSNELRRAARAGALCVVVRSSTWLPLDGQVVDDCQVSDWAEGAKISDSIVYPDEGELPSEAEPSTDSTLPITASWRTIVPAAFSEGLFPNYAIGTTRIIHGSRYLPPGYELAFVPSNADIEIGFRGDLADITVSSSYNVVKSVIAIVQILFAAATLYRTRGDQIKRYGYAAYGLSVLPYIIMSIVNLIGNILTPDFSTLYLVRSKEMTEAEDERRGGWFDGVVGVVNHTPREGVKTVSVRFEAVEGGFLVHEVAPPPKLEKQSTADDNVTSLDEEGQSMIASAAHNEEESNLLDKPKPRRTGTFNMNDSSYPTKSQKPTTSHEESTSIPMIEITTTDQQPPTPKKTWAIVSTQTISTKQTYIENNEFQKKETILAQSLLPLPHSNLDLPAISNITYTSSQSWSEGRTVTCMFLTLIMSAIPLIIISRLTRFSKGESTLAQRVWIIGWLVFGTFWGSVLPVFALDRIQTPGEKHGNGAESFGKWASMIVFMMVNSAFAVGGLVVVGQMLKEYGNCVRIT